MEFLGIGPLELVFILLIALIVLGPKDMAKAGKTLGKSMRKIVTSPQWRVITQTSQEIRNLPTRLIREAGLEEIEQDVNNLKRTTADIQSALSTSTILPPDWKDIQADQPDSSPLPTPDVADSGASTQVAPSLKPNPAPPTSSGSSADLSAWTGGEVSGDGDQHQDSSNHLSAWITPPGQTD